jgi:hypothetical protein
MPGIVTQAVAAAVMPYALASEYSEGRTWPVVEQGPMPDGRYIRYPQAAANRQEWRIGRRLSSSDFAALKAFFLARKGSLQAFYFYPVAANYDATGASTTGRYLVRFTGSFSMTHTLGRDTAAFALVQVQ